MCCNLLFPKINESLFQQGENEEQKDTDLMKVKINNKEIKESATTLSVSMRSQVYHHAEPIEKVH